MKHVYDLFEKFSDGSSLWRACVVGLEGVRVHMRDLAQHSPNQFYAMHVATGKIVPNSHYQGELPIASRPGRRNRAAAA